MQWLVVIAVVAFLVLINKAGGGLKWLSPKAALILGAIGLAAIFAVAAFR